MNQSSLTVTHSMSRTWPVQVALWLLDRPKLGQRSSVKRLAGRLLKQPAQAGVVTAQSRLGRLLCCDCDSARDQRIGVQMLQQAAKAGDCLSLIHI